MLAMLFSYRKRCAPNSPAGQLILPEALRVLPLYTLCARKMLALRANAQVCVCLCVRACVCVLFDRKTTLPSVTSIFVSRYATRAWSCAWCSAWCHLRRLRRKRHSGRPPRQMKTSAAILSKPTLTLLIVHESWYPPSAPDTCHELSQLSTRNTSLYC